MSGLGRTVTAEDGQKPAQLIQFDAAVFNPELGRAPLNDRGEVVGIVTALANPSDDAEFIGIVFAVPILTPVGWRRRRRRTPTSSSHTAGKS